MPDENTFVQQMKDMEDEAKVAGVEIYGKELLSHPAFLPNKIIDLCSEPETAKEIFCDEDYKSIQVGIVCELDKILAPVDTSSYYYVAPIDKIVRNIANNRLFSLKDEKEKKEHDMNFLTLAREAQNLEIKYVSRAITINEFESSVSSLKDIAKSDFGGELLWTNEKLSLDEIADYVRSHTSQCELLEDAFRYYYLLYEDIYQKIYKESCDDLESSGNWKAGPLGDLVRKRSDFFINECQQLRDRDAQVYEDQQERDHDRCYD